MTDYLLRRRSSFDPPRFQGWGRRRKYFEGWYFKVVIPDEQVALAFIPGVSYDEAGTGHSFLQVLDGVAATSSYHRYAIADFRSATNRFSVQIGPHTFAGDRLRVTLPALQVDLTLTDLHRWPVRPLAPGVMGWYGFIPGMQCYHGLVSLHHRLSGTIRRGGRLVKVTSGVGYTEKDWGRGFPDAWIWGQSNHLSETTEPASLMFSVASIPWLGSSFRGFLCTLLLKGKLYTFTTWTNASVAVSIEKVKKIVTVTFSDRHHQMSIVGHPAPGGNLASPIGGAMTGKINESLQAELEVSLSKNGREVYRGIAGWAGLEVSENAAAMLCE